MLTIYKKVEKTLVNPSGIIEIKSIDELTKPFLLCISAQDNFDKSVYGIIREGAQAARVYTTEELAAGFKIDQMPVDFLGLRFKSDEIYKNNYVEIVDKFIYPYLIGDKPKSVAEMQVQARRINLMTYCDGTLTYKKIESRLAHKLKEKGITQEDIDSILSQIAVVALGTMVDTRDLKATTATFVDVNDLEIATERTIGYKEMLEEKKRQSIYGTFGNNSLYIYAGSGKHDLKEYFKDEAIVKPAVCSVLTYFLEKSVAAEKLATPVVISASDILDLLTIYASDERDTKDLLAELDLHISYDNTPRYTKEEATLRMELDTVYKEMLQIKAQLERMQASKDEKELQLNLVVDGIRKYSSDTAFYQILVAAGMWQAPVGRDVFQEESDKNIRDAYLNRKAPNDDINGPKL